MKVPFVDLKAQYQSIREEIDSSIAEIIKNTQFIGGGPVREFEEQFARFIGTSHCVSCANGTDALEIALKVLGVGEGSEVLVPAMTWISTSEAVSAVGAVPVFVDIHPEYFTIDPEKIEEKITTQTRVIIPVHLYGLPCEMDRVMAIAKKHDLKVVEDCAQAHGAKYKDHRVGTFGDAATFSFYPGKNLGAYGDAGCIVTEDAELAKKMRTIANHGQQGKHNHLIEGRNSRLDTLQAAVLLAKLPHLEVWNTRRRLLAGIYSSGLIEAGIKIQAVPDYAEPVFHIFSVLIKNRNEVKAKLSRLDISTQVHYPYALPFMPAYQEMGHRSGDFPVASDHGKHELSLPMYPELTEEQLELVVKRLTSLL